MAERQNSLYEAMTNTDVSMLPPAIALPPPSVRSHSAVLAHGIDPSQFPG